MANFHSETDNVNVAPNLGQFPSGLRILVVDDDVTVLKTIEQMSAQCHYHVTTCTEAAVALNLLRERKDSFDVVISDVHMKGVDGYKFLQHVDQELNLPVIMMSADSSSAVTEGIRHGACHYLIKPVHDDDLRNIWQHVIDRKTWNQKNKEHEVVGVLEYNDPNKRGNNEDADYTSSANDANEGILVGDRRKRSSSGEEGDAVDEMGDDPPVPTKKPRFVWTSDRHQQFVNAVIQLGPKAVPKRILELMNIPDLTRENVASHLQKFRLHLKKKSDETQQQNVVLNGTTDYSKLRASRRFNMQALADSGHHVSPQTQASLHNHAELTNYPALGNMRSRENHVALMKPPSVQEPNHSHAKAFGMSTYDSKNFPQPLMAVDDASSSGYVAWEWPPISNAIDSSVGLNNDVLLNIMQQRQMQQEYQQKQQQLQLQQSMMMHDYLIYPDSVSIQPSYLVGPSQPYETLQVGVTPASVNYNYSFGRNSLIDHGTFLPQPNNSSMGTSAELCGYAATPVSVSPPMLGSRTQQLHNGAVRSPFPGLPPVSDAQVPYGSGSIDSLHHQGQVPIESHHSHIDTMKEQPNFMDSAQVDHPI